MPLACGIVRERGILSNFVQKCFNNLVHILTKMNIQSQGSYFEMHDSRYFHSEQNGIESHLVSMYLASQSTYI